MGNVCMYQQATIPSFVFPKLVRHCIVFNHILFCGYPWCVEGLDKVESELST